MVTGRLDLVERMNLQLTMTTPQDPAHPTPSIHPDVLHQICEVEVWKRVTELEANLNARIAHQVAQQVELKVQEVLSREGVSKREYGADRAFTETALENLRTAIEDLQINEEAREDEADEDGDRQTKAHQRSDERRATEAAMPMPYADTAPSLPAPLSCDPSFNQSFSDVWGSGIPPWPERNGTNGKAYGASAISGTPASTGP